MCVECVASVLEIVEPCLLGVLGIAAFGVTWWVFD